MSSGNGDGAEKTEAQKKIEEVHKQNLENFKNSIGDATVLVVNIGPMGPGWITTMDKPQLNMLLDSIKLSLHRPEKKKIIQPGAGGFIRNLRNFKR